MITFSEMFLRRKGKIIVDLNPSEKVDWDNRQYVATINKNIENLGFVFSEELFKALSKHSIGGLGKFYLKLVPALKNLIGADVEYNPMYPNFPEQVMEMSSVELYLNAIVHYWSVGTLYPVTEKQERLPLFDEGKIKVLNIGTLEEFWVIFYNLYHSKTSLSQMDKEDLDWFLKEGATNPHLRTMDLSIPHKENAAYICSKVLLDPTKKDIVSKNITTATDVLRLCVAMSDGDVSLASNTKFRSFRRKERRRILGLLKNVNLEDMYRYKEQWKRLGEKLHPMEQRMRVQFPSVAEKFKALFEDEHIETFNSMVRKATGAGDWSRALDLLVKRPGELARNLDFLLRNTDKKEEVINYFMVAANSVSTPVLLQIKEHFAHRDDCKYRVFFPKGNLAKSYNIPNELPELDAKWKESIQRICENALIVNYMQRGFLGRVYLSDAYKNFIVPFSQRSASKTFKACTRGSRFPVDSGASAIRGFIWWTNISDEAMEDYWGFNKNRVDIDLSATFFNDEWEYMEHISYTNLRSGAYKACHSGDIVDGGLLNGEGVAEFIDIDIESALKYGARYVVFQVYDFTGHGFNKLPHAMFGWMERKEVGSGEIFEPKTVVQKMDLTANTTSAIPVVFDLAAKEFIWCDMTAGHGTASNVENRLSAVAATCYAVVNMSKPNLYDLIKLHIRARGIEVENPEEADIVFDIDKGITPYDTEVFMSEYL